MPDLAGWTAVGGMALCPLMTLPLMNDNLGYGRDVLFVACAGLSLCLFSIPLLAGKRRSNIQWTAIDVLIGLSLLYSIGNSVARLPEGCNITEPILMLAAELIGYVVIRQWLTDERTGIFLFKRLLPAMLLVQLVIGGLQYAGIFQSHHYAFRITGPFFNPGPYAIYVSALAISSVPFSAWSFLSIVMAAASSAVLVQLQSRSAWLGALAGLLLLLAVGRKITSRTLVVAYLCLPLLIFGGYRLYRLKVDSATGRLLTWTVTSGLIRDHPLAGIGAGNFPASYGRYQHTLFEDVREREKFRTIAADVRYAFNDELQVTAEDGGIGLGLRLALLVAVAMRARRFLGDRASRSLPAQRRMCLAACAGLVALLTAGLFSYPMTQGPVSILFFTFCAVVSGMPLPGKFNTSGPAIDVAHNGILIRFIGSFLLFTGCFLVYAGLGKAMALAKWKKLDKALPPPGITSQSGFNPLYFWLADNGRFLLDYADACVSYGDYETAIRILEAAKAVTPDPELYYSLGQAYEATGNYDLALQQFRYVTIALPGLLRPYYLITRLYYKGGDHQAFRQTAIEALRSPIKTVTADTEEMKREIALWLRLDQLPK